MMIIQKQNLAFLRVVEGEAQGTGGRLEVSPVRKSARGVSPVRKSARGADPDAW